MQDLQPEYFFNLLSYEHKALFAGKNHLWEVLSYLKPYLASLPLGKVEAKISDGAYIIDRHLISIGKGSVVEPGAYIKGPCYIGNDCTIRHGAYIRGDVLIGNGCVVGHDTEVKHSIFLNEVHAAHFAYLGDTILGNRVNLGAGTICANLKFNRAKVAVGGIDTGLSKFGAIIGDDSQTGCNSVTNPGTCVGQSVWIYPCTNVGGFIPSHSTVKNKVQLEIVSSLS